MNLHFLLYLAFLFTAFTINNLCTLAQDESEFTEYDSIEYDSKESEEEIEIYLDFNDCGGESVIKTQLSMTPYPLVARRQKGTETAIISDKLTLWLSGDIFTFPTIIAPQQLSDTMQIEPLDLNLKFAITFFSDQRTQNITTIRSFNMSETIMRSVAYAKSHLSVFVNEFVKVHSNYSFFQSFSLSSHKVNLEMYALLLLSMNIFDVSPVSEIRLRTEFSVTSKHSICMEASMDIKVKEQSNSSLITRNQRNFENLFQTPKVNGACLGQSVEKPDGLCQCPYPRAGPLCSLQCNLDQMIVYFENCEECENMTNKFSILTKSEYAYFCLLKQNVSLLKKPLEISIINVDDIIMHWSIINYFMPEEVQYVIYLKSEKHDLNITIKETSVNFFKINTGQNYHFQKHCKKSDQCEGNQLIPFTYYKVLLKLRFMHHDREEFLLVGSGHFTSTNISIVTAKITDDNHIIIEWKLLGYCPDFIVRIQANITCNDKEQQILLEGTLIEDACRRKIARLSNSTIPLTYKCGNSDVFLRIRAKLFEAGFGNWSDTYVIRARRISPLIIAGAFVSAVLLIALLAVIAGAYLNYRRQKIERQRLFDEIQTTSADTVDINNALSRLDHSKALIEQADCLPYLHCYEIDFERITFGQEIGRGCFSSVKSGQLRQLHTSIATEGENVAIKQLKSEFGTLEDLKMLLDELKVMIAIGPHVNIVQLIAAVTKRIPHGEIYIVMEFCEGGSLLSLLQRSSKNILLAKQMANGYDTLPLLPTDCTITIDNMAMTLASFAYQIANGMIFISNKDIIHRDLAARNVLVTADSIIKIAECGLARESKQHYTARRGKVPTASMALETFENFYYSIQSDVWSYGVLLWEMFSLGEDPEGNYPSGREAIYKFLTSGDRLACPEYASTDLYENLMLRCWTKNPLERPSFEKCKKYFEEQLRGVFPEALSKLKKKLEITIVEIDQRTALPIQRETIH